MHHVLSIKKPSLLERFYEFEPKMIPETELLRFSSPLSPKGEDLSERIAKTISAPKKRRKVDPIFQGLAEAPKPGSLTKRTRTGYSYGK